MNNEINTTMSEFKIERSVFSLMHGYDEHKVVFNKEEILCVGGVEYDFEKEHLTVYRDFFNKEEISLFTDADGDFVAEYITHRNFYNESDDENGIRIEVHRTDGILYVYCTKPSLLVADIEVENIWSLCNETIMDYKETREIDGVLYNVTNPAQINPFVVPKDVYNDIREILDADDFKDFTLKFYFVRSYQQRKFYVGLWNATEHCPVNFAIKGKGNSDYSKVYELIS